ncbi:MAG: hypothetical protein KF753_24260 [Caldilineaceae bacterium]|nr:hypothetical protein [Caldilineaceae bacterium]
MTTATTAPASRVKSISDPAYQAFQILHIGFTVAPILFGLDKFLNLMADWTSYVAPIVASIVPAGPFMLFVGVVEIAAGLLVFFKPRIGAYVVALWLLGIILNLLLIPGFFDVALRDFGLMLGALALGRLSQVFSD